MSAEEITAKLLANLLNTTDDHHSASAIGSSVTVDSAAPRSSETDDIELKVLEDDPYSSSRSRITTDQEQQSNRTNKVAKTSGASRESE